MSNEIQDEGAGVWETDRLREENERLRTDIERLNQYVLAAESRRDKAEAEVERLRRENAYLRRTNAVEELDEAKRRITRLRKAVNWLIGALEAAPKPRYLMRLEYEQWYDGTRWDIDRGKAVLEKERDESAPSGDR